MLQAPVALLLVGAIWAGQSDVPAPQQTPLVKEANSARPAEPPTVAATVPGDQSGSPESGGGSPVPEPTTLLLVGTGLVGLALSSRRWRRTLARNG